MKRHAQNGYTLIEILTVVAVLAILMSIVMIGASKYRQRAYIEGTKGLIQTISAALEQYKSDFGQYPPDGFDPAHKAIRVLQGSNTPQEIRGSACLLYYLTTPMMKEVETGEDVQRKRLSPYMELKDSQVSGTGDMNAKLADPRNEVLDSWGNPIHYQRVDIDPTTQKARLFDQSAGSVHSMPNMASSQHGPDPRRGAGGLVSKKAGSYDLWSHGVDVNDTTDDIANWTD